MTDTEKAGIATGFAHAAAEIAKTPLPYLLGLALFAFALRWDGRLYAPQACFKLQEIRGVVYKLDMCSGGVEKIDMPTTPTAPASGSTPNNSFKPTPLRGAA